MFRFRKKREIIFVTIPPISHNKISQESSDKEQKDLSSLKYH